MREKGAKGRGLKWGDKREGWRNDGEKEGGLKMKNDEGQREEGEKKRMKLKSENNEKKEEGNTREGE